MEVILGIVKDGRFKRVSHEFNTVGSGRLTQIPMQAARSPETGEIDLSEYEGSAIMVQGRPSIMIP